MENDINELIKTVLELKKIIKSKNKKKTTELYNNFIIQCNNIKLLYNSNTDLIKLMDYCKYLVTSSVYQFNISHKEISLCEIDNIIKLMKNYCDI